MASDLREKLWEAWKSKHYLSGIDAMADGARLALESLSCPFGDDCAGVADENKCTRCAALASLASEGKGG
jgi:hypothetical protein